MKIREFGTTLLIALETVAPALAAKPVTMAQGCILIEPLTGERKMIRVSATDGSICLRSALPVSVHGAIEDDTPALIPGKELLSFFKFATGWTDMSTANNRIRMACGSYRGALPVVDAATFPQVKTPDAGRTTRIEIERERLADALARTIPFASANDSRLMLTGVNFHYDSADRELRLTALDGYRLSTVAIRATREGEAESVSFTVPGRSAAILMQTAKRAGGLMMSLETDGEVLRAVAGTAEMTTVLLAGQYIDYKKIIPTGGKHQTKCTREAMLDALSRISVFGGTSPVRLRFEPSVITMTATEADGELQAECAAKTQGIPEGSFEIALNRKYLSDCLKACGHDNIEIWMNTEFTPVIMFPQDGTPADSWLTLVLPVRVMH